MGLLLNQMFGYESKMLSGTSVESDILLSFYNINLQKFTYVLDLHCNYKFNS